MNLILIIIASLISTMTINSANKLNFYANRIVLESEKTYLFEKEERLIKFGQMVKRSETGTNFLSKWNTNGFVKPNNSNFYAFKIDSTATKPYIIPLKPEEEISMNAYFCGNGNISWGIAVKNNKMDLNNYYEYQSPC